NRAEHIIQSRGVAARAIPTLAERRDELSGIAVGRNRALARHDVLPADQVLRRWENVRYFVEGREIAKRRHPGAAAGNVNHKMVRAEVGILEQFETSIGGVQVQNGAAALVQVDIGVELNHKVAAGEVRAAFGQRGGGQGADLVVYGDAGRDL